MQVLSNSGDFFPNSKTTGATGSTSTPNQGAASDVFGTAAPQGTGAPGSNGGQSATDAVSVTHNAFAEDMYVKDTENFGTSRVGQGIEGQSGNKTTGAGEGTPNHKHWS